jgi:hypothetical protein
MKEHMEKSDKDKEQPSSSYEAGLVNPHKTTSPITIVYPVDCVIPTGTSKKAINKFFGIKLKDTDSPDTDLFENVQIVQPQRGDLR